jgi:neutral ceramidase
MTQLRAGFARRDITQPLGTPSSLGLHVLVEEIWDPLTATACVIESDGRRMAIVGVDLCGLLEGSHEAIRSAVASATGGAIAADHVIVNVSHSHSAPYLSDDAQAILRPFGMRLHDDAYAAALPGLVADAVVEASDRAQPMEVSVGRGRVEHVAANRRPRNAEGRTVHRYGRPPQELRDLPEGLIDPDVAVIRFTGRTGVAGAVMVYACHATSSSVGTPPYVSADFPGHARTALEAEFGHPFVFLQGCAGNVGTGKWVAGTAWEDTVAMGARLARGAADAMGAGRTVDASAMRVGITGLPLDLDPFPPVAELERRLETAISGGDFGPIMAVCDALVVARRLDELRRARLTAIAFGPDLALVALPGEVFLEHGLAIRAGSPFRETIVSAYNDNTLQYMPTREAFPEGEYEVNGGWRYIRPGEGERMAAETVRVLAGLRPT